MLKMAKDTKFLKRTGKKKRKMSFLDICTLGYPGHVKITKVMVTKATLLLLTFFAPKRAVS